MKSFETPPREGLGATSAEGPGGKPEEEGTQPLNESPERNAKR